MQGAREPPALGVRPTSTPGWATKAIVPTSTATAETASAAAGATSVASSAVSSGPSVNSSSTPTESIA